MDPLQIWLTAQFAEKKVEPNSGLGLAIRYLLKHGERLTLFLRQPGAPLDNNICERALQKAILHRKNSLFYKTEKGARVGDRFLSLIPTCQRCGAHPFDYLTQLQGPVAEWARNPSLWMPWNYRETLPRAGIRVDSGERRRNPAWPETIVLGQAGASLENGRKTGPWPTRFA